MGSHGSTLGDFTATPRLLSISGLALGIGVISAYVALGLIRLIGFFTNIFFFQRLSADLVSPADHHLGPLVVLVPIVGALIIGVMARYGSERIRGHGIPEAIEAILINGSRVEPRVAVLKPLSSAVSIGSGGPFGAEGPIIMTGGAVGSLIAQFFHLTSTERKTLLVAGAAAGMAATFAAPLAAVLLAVELLLFEWKPRSLVPVALASGAAAATRRYIIGIGPLFPVPAHPVFIGPQGLFGCVVCGLLAGILSALLTQAVYASEDAFQRLPIHWMWWPAIGGLVIGLGGLVFPQALGVGYDTIGALLQGEVAARAIVGVLVVKSIIWSVSLGSGTSGGVLAPLLMMGGALGGVESWILPHEGVGFWPLVSMGAILGGTMRSPLTGVVFALELTHDVNMLLPLLVAVTIAHAFTVLTLRRSILTEKVARRGYHLSREYSIDPLEILFVREVMRTNVAALPASARADTLAVSLRGEPVRRRQRLYPVVGDRGELVGVVTRTDLQHIVETCSGTTPAPLGGVKPGTPSAPLAALKTGATTSSNAVLEACDAPLASVLREKPVVAYPDESLRVVVYRMADTGLTRFPVVNRDGTLVGMIALTDLLKARALNLEAERRRERVLGGRIAVAFSPKQKKTA
jgi:H+/Cl- antiporter ClcA/CBS-domain-containing membrane protein